MLRRFLPLALLLATLVFWLPRILYSRTAAWETIAPGIEFRSFNTSPASGKVRILALRVQARRLHIVAGHKLDADGWRRRSHAVAAVNGGFFTPMGVSLGLRISDGVLLSRLRPADWGVFTVMAGKAHIAHTASFRLHPGYREAVQCGPRLVVRGKTTRLKSQWARRTALGIQRDGKVIVAISDGEIGFPDWAALWAAPSGLNCIDAMGLDGGGSTQLSLRSAHRSINIEGFTEVPDAVVIR